MNRWLRGNSPSLRLIQKTNKPEKFPFTTTNNGIILAVRWSVKYFYAENSPIFWKSGEEEDGENWQMQNVLLFKQTQYS